MKYQQDLEKIIIKKIPKMAVWFEVLAVTLLVTFFGYIVGDGDVFFIGSQFPLLWFAPLLVSLKYGVLPGLSSALILTSAVFINDHFEVLGILQNPMMYSLGMLLVAFLSGEFSDIWHRRLFQLSEASQYLSLRVKEVERSYLLMKVSHDHLEKERVKKPLSLHGHSFHLRKQVFQMKSGGSSSSELRALAGQLIELFSNFGKLNIASLHSVLDNRWIEEVPLATFGAAVDINRGDPLLSQVLKTQMVVSLHEEQMTNNKQGQLLVVVPIIDLEGKMWAIIAVHKMPFEAFHLNDFQTLAVIGNHVGDLLLNRTRIGRDIQSDRLFIAELERCISDRNNYGLDSTLLGFQFKCSVKSKALKKLILKHRPGLSSVLEPVRQGLANGFLILLPLMDEKECSAYLDCLEKEIEEHFGFSSFYSAETDIIRRSIVGSDRGDLLLNEFSVSGQLSYVTDASLDDFATRLVGNIGA